ncbi:hypothetical protein P7L68_03165 (plasmid) [Tistrella mobilis]|jgi:hypothetical protein|uniref:hypothetical protein n=1 Tax=Tistrella mobilis TaxID=171437 RepID=UPI0035573301
MTDAATIERDLKRQRLEAFELRQAALVRGDTATAAAAAETMAAIDDDLDCLATTSIADAVARLDGLRARLVTLRAAAAAWPAPPPAAPDGSPPSDQAGKA